MMDNDGNKDVNTEGVDYFDDDDGCSGDGDGGGSFGHGSYGDPYEG